MATNAIVPKIKTEGLATRNKIIKDLYKVEGKKDVYFVKYENGSKELIYTYEESDIVPKNGSTIIDMSEFDNCIRIYEIDGTDYAICTKSDGFVYVLKIPEKAEIFKIFSDSSIVLKRIDERYILIFSLSLDNSIVFDVDESKISLTLAQSEDIDKASDYYVLSRRKPTENNDIIYENDIYDRNWKKLIQIDGYIYIYGDKLVKKNNDSIEVYEIEKKDKEKRIFRRQDWHLYKPSYVPSKGEIITFDQGQISIFDLDFNKKETIEIPDLNGEISAIDTDGNNLLMIYYKNCTIFFNLDTKTFLKYSNSIWRFPYNTPSAFIGINNEEQRIYHIHDKKFKEVASIEIAETDLDNGPGEPLYENKEGCIFTIKNFENKWTLINTITGKCIEMDGYNYFLMGRNCICGIKKIEEKDVIDVYDFNFIKKFCDFDYEKYGKREIGILPIELIGNCIYYKGRYDIGQLKDLEPEYIFGLDGQTIFGFDRQKMTLDDERNIQRKMLESKVYERELFGKEYLLIVSKKGDKYWLDTKTLNFYSLKNGKFTNVGQSYREAISMENQPLGITQDSK